MGRPEQLVNFNPLVLQTWKTGCGETDLPKSHRYRFGLRAQVFWPQSNVISTYQQLWTSLFLSPSLNSYCSSPENL